MAGTISLLGSTGSIGRQTLEVARELGLKVAALTANRSIELLEQQAREFLPQLVVLGDMTSALELAGRLRGLPIRVAYGMEGLLEAASLNEADTVVTAVVGMVGLRPTLAAIGKGKRIALPNAEVMIHQPSGGAQGQATEIQIVAEQILKTKEKLNRILSENTGKPYEEVCRDTERDNWLTAQEALDYGIIDRILDKH